MRDRNENDRKFLRQWIRATWLGWVLGIPILIVLALIGEVAGIGGAQVLVGVGIGAGIGLMQGRALRNVLIKSAAWFWSCVIGLGLPFLAADLAKIAGMNFPYSLYLCVALGGIIIGVWQASLLRPRENAGWWIVGSVLGWTLASGAAAIADLLFRSRSLQGLWGAAVYLGIVAGGGLILGLVTGILLVRVLRAELQPTPLPTAEQVVR